MANEIKINSNFSQAFWNELQQVVKGSVDVRTETRQAHTSDITYHSPMPPDAVLYPTSTAELSKIMQCCAKYKIPVIPYGAGTSVEGHTLAVQGGICLDMSRMNRIVKMDTENCYATVEAGVRRKELDDALKGSGLFFPIGPGVNASLGGMAATRASGINAVKYGTMRTNVMALTVVLPDGKIIRTGSKARKSSAGYDLTNLLIGAEGTLGIITELTVRLYPMPEAIFVAAVSFTSFEQAVAATIQIIKRGIPVASIELLDEVTLRAVNAYSSLDYPVEPTVFIEFHGIQEEVNTYIQRVEKIITDAGATAVRWATDTTERIRLAKARTDVLPAVMALKPGSKVFGTDVCVPVSNLAACITETKKDIEKYGLIAPLFGHVGDGNFHLTILVDPSDKIEIEKARELNRAMVHRAIQMEGTCTGEHGIGVGKIEFMQEEHGAALSIMHAIKKAIDPMNIMNPGKILPTEIID